MYINFEVMDAEGFGDKELLVLVRINQKEVVLSHEELTSAHKLVELGYAKLLKGGKSFHEKLRIDKKGTELLTKVGLRGSISAIELCDELVEEFEAVGVETGNKRKCLQSINWLLEKSEITEEDLRMGIDSWLSRGYQMWLCNILWNQKEASVFTTLNSRDLSQSPIYEFIRREKGDKW